MAVEHIKLLQSIVCDDIRREDNGKFILIGVYSTGICMNVMPVEIPLCIWMQFELQSEQTMVLEFRIEGSALQEEVTFALQVNEPCLRLNKQVVPFMAKFPVKINSIGALRINYRKAGTEAWQAINEVEINKNETALPNTVTH